MHCTTDRAAAKVARFLFGKETAMRAEKPRIRNVALYTLTTTQARRLTILEHCRRWVEKHPGWTILLLLLAGGLAGGMR